MNSKMKVMILWFSRKVKKDFEERDTPCANLKIFFALSTLTITLAFFVLMQQLNHSSIISPINFYSTNFYNSYISEIVSFSASKRFSWHINPKSRTGAIGTSAHMNRLTWFTSSAIVSTTTSPSTTTSHLAPFLLNAPQNTKWANQRLGAGGCTMSSMVNYH